ncbi:hypothetical protein BDV40DRAFT_163515 [Aspergillus tamarii]|uniref:Uncharacterized protein n=1 Tax=Aspergillus tamarii TaxID=41984 RepID=A0A5N6UV70_ASPTM|nr:hypothetical protein BDV40DRAFT_163515 [Aspergillus tamarii]
MDYSGTAQSMELGSPRARLHPFFIKFPLSSAAFLPILFLAYEVQFFLSLLYFLLSPACVIPSAGDYLHSSFTPH